MNIQKVVDKLNPVINLNATLDRFDIFASSKFSIMYIATFW